MPAAAKAETCALGDDFVEAADRALASGKLDQISDAELEAVMTAAVRLYAAKAEASDEDVQPVAAERVTPTDIVVTVSALIRAVGLNLWDLSMWFNREKR
jgi:prophage DNA circulation protein